MNSLLAVAVLYDMLDIYEEALKLIVASHTYTASGALAKHALWKATKLSQPASEPEKP